MLDWQLSRVSSPAVDISYILFTSTVKSLRDAHLDEFLQVYYTNLAHTIRATGSDPDVLFPEAELQRQLRQFGVHGVLMAPVLIPIIIADSTEIASMDEMAETMESGKEIKRTHTNLSAANAKEFGRRIQDVISDARRLGWLK